MDKRGWTIYRVAKEANIPWSTVRNMFKRNTEPSIATLECICQGMGMTLSEFFNEDDTSNSLSPRQQELLDDFALLSESDKRIVCDLTKSLSQKQK